MTIETGTKMLKIMIMILIIGKKEDTEIIQIKENYALIVTQINIWLEIAIN